LLLDEPANHLDMAARAALEEALTDYPGAVILVTHDRDLMEATCDGLWVVTNGGVVSWEGSLDSYLEQAIREEPAPTSGGIAATTATRDPKEIRRQTAQIRDRLRQETRQSRQRLEKLEKTIETLEAERTTLQATLAAPEAYASESRERLKEHVNRLGQLEGELQTAMSQWEALSLELEASESEAEEAINRIRIPD
ncbi:MAG: hypothetical protein HQM00_04280, partial [Magnetococcales bacterium]|nr:hypothetical protein [Magnetococcales bacterium]